MRLWHIAATAALLLSGCSSLQVVSSYDRHVDFTTLSHANVTYVAQDDGENFVRERIARELKETLQKRGFSIVSKSEAGLHVKVYLFIRQKSRIETSYDYIPATFAGYYRPSYFNRPLYLQRNCSQGTVYRMSSIYEYEEQRLVVEMRETKSNSIVWHATATDTFSSGDWERYDSGYIKKMIQKVLADFPPH